MVGKDKGFQFLCHVILAIMALLVLFPLALLILSSMSSESDIIKYGYRLLNAGGGAVRNWFLSDNDLVKEGYFSVMDSAEDILNGARPVLAKYVPELLRVLEAEMIPLGLQMKSILERSFEDKPDILKTVNEALHEIKKEL